MKQTCHQWDLSHYPSLLGHWVLPPAGSLHHTHDNGWVAAGGHTTLAYLQLKLGQTYLRGKRCNEKDYLKKGKAGGKWANRRAKKGLTVVYPLKGEISGVERPFSEILHSLRFGQFLGKVGSLGTWCKEGRGLESHYRPGEKTQSAGMQLETLQHVGRIKESDHGNSTGK